MPITISFSPMAVHEHSSSPSSHTMATPDQTKAPLPSTQKSDVAWHPSAASLHRMEHFVNTRYLPLSLIFGISLILLAKFTLNWVPSRLEGDEHNFQQLAMSLPFLIHAWWKVGNLACAALSLGQLGTQLKWDRRDIECGVRDPFTVAEMDTKRDQVGNQVTMEIKRFFRLFPEFPKV